MPHAILKKTLFPALRTFYTEISGIDNIPRHQPVIVAANHVGFIDYFFIASVFAPRTGTHLRFIAKRLWLRDVFMKRWWGQIVIDPNNREACLHEAWDYLKKGDTVVIFPEGTATENGPVLLPARRGVAKLALWSRVPVLPVGFIGPVRRKKYFLDPRNLWSLLTFFKKTRIRIGSPLYFPDQYGRPADRGTLDKVTRSIMKAIAPLCDKTYL